ncbi:MAG: polysaccharide deacetylase family protein [bacterium]|nr:polysaccharide deacetylase family protein [bacterium]
MSLRNALFNIASSITTPLFRNFQKNKIIILMYHRVLNVDPDYPFDEDLISATPENFEAQMKYLNDQYKVITFDDLPSILNNKGKNYDPKIIITFDDGYLDNYLYAYPILKKYQIPATIFLTTDYIDGKRELFWWDEVAYFIKKTSKSHINIDKVGNYPLHKPHLKKKAIIKIQMILKKMSEEEKNNTLEKLKSICEVTTCQLENMFVSWTQIKEMSNHDICFGAHTCSHIIVTRASLANAEEEIIRSRKIIEEKIGKKIKIFSYPNGKNDDYSQDIIKVLQRNKFDYATLTIDGINSLKYIANNPYALRRVGMRISDNLNYFKLQLCGALVGIRKIRTGILGENFS